MRPRGEGLAFGEADVARGLPIPACGISHSPAGDGALGSTLRTDQGRGDLRGPASRPARCRGRLFRPASSGPTASPDAPGRVAWRGSWPRPSSGASGEVGAPAAALGGGKPSGSPSPGPAGAAPATAARLGDALLRVRAASLFHSPGSARPRRFFCRLASRASPCDSNVDRRWLGQSLADAAWVVHSVGAGEAPCLAVVGTDEGCERHRRRSRSRGALQPCKKHKVRSWRRPRTRCCSRSR